MRITGTSNLTSSLNAYSFAAKGHYYELSEEAESSKPNIYDSGMNLIQTNVDDDDTFLSVEPLSGVCLVALERIFMNMQLLGDDLFQNTTVAIPSEYGYFYPLSYVKRESTWTQDQVDEVYGPIYMAHKIKWSFFAILLFFGLVFLALTVLFGLRYMKLNKAVHGLVLDVEEDPVQNGGRDSLINDDISPLTGQTRTGGNDVDSEAEFTENAPNVD